MNEAKLNRTWDALYLEDMHHFTLACYPRPAHMKSDRVVCNQFWYIFNGFTVRHNSFSFIPPKKSVQELGNRYGMAMAVFNPPEERQLSLSINLVSTLGWQFLPPRKKNPCAASATHIRCLSDADWGCNPLASSPAVNDEVSYWNLDEPGIVK